MPTTEYASSGMVETFTTSYTRIITEEEESMIPTNRRPTHPGRILKEMYLKPRGVSLRALGGATGVSRKHLSRIINGHVGVSVELATKLAATLNTTPELWVNAQRNIDLYDARRRLSEWRPKRVFKAQGLQTT